MEKRTNYERYCKIADINKNKSTSELLTGDFIFCFVGIGKENGLKDFINWNEADFSYHKRLCKIVDIIEVQEDFDLLNNWMKNEAPTNRGGGNSDDLPDGCDMFNLTKEEIGTFYSLVTVYRNDKGQFIAVNCEGYNYWRYVGLPLNYRIMYAAERITIKAQLKKEREEVRLKHEATLKEYKQALQARKEELKQIYSFLTLNPADGKQMILNIRKFLKYHLPNLEFKISARYDSYCGGFNCEINTSKDTPEEVRSQIKEVCESWTNETMLTGEYDYNDYGEYEAHENLMNSLFGKINYKLYQYYTLNKPYNEPKENNYHNNEDLKDYSGSLKIINYSEKSIALLGDTKAIKDILKNMGGRFNSHLSCGSGWIFKKDKEIELRAKFNITNED